MGNLDRALYELGRVVPTRGSCGGNISTLSSSSLLEDLEEGDNSVRTDDLEDSDDEESGNRKTGRGFFAVMSRFGG
jgi:hypothetical protein